jgi:hypothetical protein
MPTTPALADHQTNEGQGAQPAPGGSQQAGQQEQAVAPPVEKPIGQPETAVANQQTQTEQPSPYAVRDVTAQEDMVFWAMMMFIAAAATFIVTTFGTILIRRQVILTREAVVDTGKATVAMETGNKIARDTASRQLRAYMGINHYTLTPYNLGNAQSGRFLVQMKNFGQTPAVGLTTTVSYAIRDWVDQDTKPDAWDFTTAKLPIDVAPGAPMFRDVSFAEHALAHAVELENGASVLWVKFHALYEDVFGREHEQTTFFFSRRHAYVAGDMLVGDQTPEISRKRKRKRAR